MSEDKKKVGYWIGAGVLGPGIKYGQPIYSGMVDPKTIEFQKKQGNIQEFEVSAKVKEDHAAADKIISDQEDQIKALKRKLTAAENDIVKLKKRIAELEAQSEESLQAEIENLKAENKKLKKGKK